MAKGIFEILEETEKKKTQKEKIEYLQSHGDNNTLKEVLGYTFFPPIKWRLPPGTPPYTPCDPVNAETFLYQELRRLYLFTEAGPDMHAFKREALYIEFLESIHPEDAKIVLSMREKKLPYKGITENLIKKAFPGLIDEEVQEV